MDMLTQELGNGAQCVYRVVEDGAELMDCVFDGACLELPAVVRGLRVSALDEGAFRQAPHLRELRCPAHAVRIHRFAFYECRDMVRLMLPSDIAAFDVQWIKRMGQLKHLRLPDALEQVSLDFMREFRGLTVCLGKSTRSVALLKLLDSRRNALEVCSENTFLSFDGTALLDASGKTVVKLVMDVDAYQVPNGVVEIGAKAFATAAGLREVRLPATLERIADMAFMGCGLRRFNAPAALREVGSRACYQCRGLQELRLCEGLTAIGTEAFAETALTELRIPASVTCLGWGVAHKTGLAAQKGQRGSLSVAEGNPAYFADAAGCLYWRDAGEVRCFDATLVGQEEFATHPDTTVVGANAFFANACVRAVHLNEGVRSIEENAFKEATALERVVFPQSLESIGSHAFDHTVLASFALGPCVSHIHDLAFAGTSFGVASGPHKGRVTLSSGSVDARNPTYAMLGDVLCERLDGGEYRALAYAGAGPRLELPPEVTRYGAGFLTGCSNLDYLSFYDTMTESQPNGWCVDEAIKTVEIRFTKPYARRITQPIRYLQGQLKYGQDITTPISALFPSRAATTCPDVQAGDTLTLRFVPQFDGKQLFIQGFAHGEFLPELSAYSSDMTMMNERNSFRRYRWICDRLSHPLLFSAYTLELFEHSIRPCVVKAAAEFIAQGYTEGLLQLIGLGLIDAQNKGEIMALANDSGNVELCAQLLEALSGARGLQALAEEDL